MLKTYRIIPSTFILFLFGLTLISVSPVFAEDSPEFTACKQIKPRGNFKLMQQKKNCFRDVARLFQGQSGPAQPVAPIDPSGGEVAQLNNRIAELEGQLSNARRARAFEREVVAELEGKLADAVRTLDRNRELYLKENATLTQQLSEAQSYISAEAGDSEYCVSGEGKKMCKKMVRWCAAHARDRYVCKQIRLYEDGYHGSQVKNGLRGEKDGIQ